MECEEDCPRCISLKSGKSGFIVYSRKLVVCILCVYGQIESINFRFDLMKHQRFMDVCGEDFMVVFMGIILWVSYTCAGKHCVCLLVLRIKTRK